MKWHLPNFIWVSKVLALLGLFWALESAADCNFQLASHPLLPEHFQSSPFGLVHAERPGQTQYSQWSADTANQVLAAIRNGKPSNNFFEIGIQARREFARKFEGVENPEEDYGTSRITRSRNDVGEDMMGLSSITLAMTAAAIVPPNFTNWPHQWWPNIAHNKTRSELANSAIRQLRKAHQLSTLDYNLLIMDRHYESSGGMMLKSSSSKFQKLRPGEQDSPYLVSTLNAPKPEINLLMEDVLHRIKKALAAKDKMEARRELGHAMYGFFNAMPYYRGSAAIGRIVFTALFSQVEDQPVVIHPECDVMALNQNQYEYLDNLPQIVRPTSANATTSHSLPF